MSRRVSSQHPVSGRRRDWNSYQLEDSPSLFAVSNTSLSQADSSELYWAFLQAASNSEGRPPLAHVPASGQAFLSGPLPSSPASTTKTGLSALSVNRIPVWFLCLSEGTNLHTPKGQKNEFRKHQESHKSSHRATRRGAKRRSQRGTHAVSRGNGEVQSVLVFERSSYSQAVS